VIHVANKVDLPAAWSIEQVPGAVGVSALRGDGLDALVDRMGATLVPQAPPPGAPVVFDARQADVLRDVRGALTPESLDQARARLDELLPPRAR